MKLLLTALTTLFAALMLGPALSGITVAKDDLDPFASSCQANPGAAVCQEAQTDGTDPLTSPNGTLNRVVNILALISGTIAVIIIIVAGITMILSGGDSTKVQNSRNAIIYAVIGLVVIAVARGIVALVVNLL